jgi:hypothetical protein
MGEGAAIQRIVAHRRRTAVDEPLALHGIDEMRMMFREDPAYDENKEHRHGERVLLWQRFAEEMQTDGDRDVAAAWGNLAGRF